MTNTKFRKRALLSSVAMLLVALVALGSATFAWFTQDPTSTVSGLSLKTETSASLVVLSQTEAILKGSGADATAKESNGAGAIANYSHSTYLNAEANGSNYQSKSTPFVLQPASLDYGKATAASNSAISFYKIAADKSSGYAASPTANTQNANYGLATTNEVYAEKIYLAVQGSTVAETAYLTSIKMKKNSAAADMYKGVRIAVSDLSGTKILGVWGIDTAGNLYLTKANDTFANAKSDGNYTMTSLADDTADTHGTTASDLAIGAVSPTAGNSSVTLYVYLDGEDDEVKSSAVDASTLIDSIELKFSVASATA